MSIGIAAALEGSAAAKQLFLNNLKIALGELEPKLRAHAEREKK